MNATIQTILAIDASTRELREKTRTLLAKEDANAQQVVADLSAQSEAAMRAEAQAKVEAIQANTKETINTLKGESEKDIAALRVFFDTKKEEFVQSLFQKLRP